MLPVFRWLGVAGRDATPAGPIRVFWMCGLATIVLVLSVVSIRDRTVDRAIGVGDHHGREIEVS